MKALVVAVLVLLTSLHATRAMADEGDDAGHTYRTVVDRVELEPASITGQRLRVYLSALSLQGQQLDLTEPKSIKAMLGNSELKVPYSLGTFDATRSDLAVAVLVQSTLDYTDVLPMISDTLDRDLLGALADGAQVVVLPFGEATSTGKLATAKSLRGKISLTSDGSAGDPALLDTLDRALLLLRKLKGTPETRPIRKLVIIIGDGRDAAADRDRVTRTGTKAAKDGVRIHTLAFSPNDVRRPMLLLGELSRQSLGTFRWVRKAAPDSWKAAIESVRDEISKQYVLTYFVGPDNEVAGKKLHIETVGRTVTSSNEMKVPEPSCGGAECASGYCASDRCVQVAAGGGRGVLGWVLLIGGIGVGAVLVLGVIGYFMSKNQPRPQMPPTMPYPGYPGYPAPGMPQAPPPVAAKPAKQPKKQKGAPVVAPGFLPNGRPVPALLILSGPRTGERYLIRNGFLIGKQPGCDLIIEDGYTSSQHAQIAMDAIGNCKLYDRGSTNGTYINGVRITEVPLQHGVNIRIGSTELRFLTE